MKKSKVSWPSDSMLCQVKMFLKEECPAKVGSNPPRRIKTEYAPKRSISHIPRIKWKRPPKFIINETLLVGSGGDSIEALNENLRIASVLEVFYPHRSLIPSRPCVSLAVQEESYDDTTTPNIRLTPIEDEPQESTYKSTTLEPDLSLAAVMKTNEQRSLIDADLLIKILSDPNIVKNLMNGTICKPLEATNDTNITKPRLPLQHDTSLAMDRNTTPVPVLVQSSVSSATLPPLNKPVCHTYPLPTLEDSLKQSLLDDVAVSEQNTPQSQSQSLNNSTFSNWNINKVKESDPQMINRDDQVSAKPVKNVDYFKNLIKEHGGHNESNNYKGRDDNVNIVKVKVKEQCIYFGRGRGCKRGESCLFFHDRSKRDWHDVPSQFPKAKRLRNAATR